MGTQRTVRLLSRGPIFPIMRRSDREPSCSSVHPRPSLAVPNIDYLSAYGLAHLQISVKLTDYASARIPCIPGDSLPDDHSRYAALG